MAYNIDTVIIIVCSYTAKDGKRSTPIYDIMQYSAQITGKIAPGSLFTDISLLQV